MVLMPSGFSELRSRNFASIKAGIAAAREYRSPLVGWIQDYGREYVMYRFWASGQVDKRDQGAWRVIIEANTPAEGATA